MDAELKIYQAKQSRVKIISTAPQILVIGIKITDSIHLYKYINNAYNAAQSNPYLMYSHFPIKKFLRNKMRIYVMFIQHSVSHPYSIKMLLTSCQE